MTKCVNKNAEYDAATLKTYVENYKKLHNVFEQTTIDNLSSICGSGIFAKIISKHGLKTTSNDLYETLSNYNHELKLGLENDMIRKIADKCYKTFI